MPSARLRETEEGVPGAFWPQSAKAVPRAGRRYAQDERGERHQEQEGLQGPDTSGAALAVGCLAAEVLLIHRGIVLLVRGAERGAGGGVGGPGSDSISSPRRQRPSGRAS